MTLAPTSSRGGSSGGGGTVLLDAVETAISVSSPATILTSNAVVITAGMLVLVELSAAYCSCDAAQGALDITIWVGASSRGNMGYVYAPGVTGQRQGITFQRYFTDLSAGSTTFTTKVTGTGAVIFAGDGLGAGDTPIQMRVWHVVAA